MKFHNRHHTNAHAPHSKTFKTKLPQNVGLAYLHVKSDILKYFFGFQSQRVIQGCKLDRYDLNHSVSTFNALPLKVQSYPPKKNRFEMWRELYHISLGITSGDFVLWGHC